MDIISDLLKQIEPYEEIIYIILIVILSFTIFSIILKFIKRKLLKRVKRKKQISNVLGFIGLLKFLFFIFLPLIVIFAYFGGWGEVGFLAGLLSVALGMALQKPISGVFAWIIIITRRPFAIGDRIIISDIKGDVHDISLSHIYLEEVGGTIEGEEKSNRMVMLPTSIIFEEEIINYTGRDDYILDEVTMAITYESDLDLAETMMIDSVKKIMRSYWKSFPKRLSKDPHIRLKCKPSGVDVTVRYNSIATSRNQISTNIIREILRKIAETNKVEIAYPHTQLLMPDNKKII